MQWRLSKILEILLVLSLCLSLAIVKLGTDWLERYPLRVQPLHKSWRRVGECGLSIATLPRVGYLRALKPPASDALDPISIPAGVLSCGSFRQGSTGFFRFAGIGATSLCKCGSLRHLLCPPLCPPYS